MSRLGDLLRKERLALQMTEKQVAKKCGVSEVYVMEVEKGERIINDEALLRILKKIGASEQVVLPFAAQEANVYADPAPKPQPKPAPPRTETRSVLSVSSDAPVDQPSASWVNALNSAMCRLPIFDVTHTQIGYSMVYVERGKLHGLPAEQACFVECPDDSLLAMNICAGDRLLMVPCAQPMSGCIQWINLSGTLALYFVTKLEGNLALLQTWKGGRLTSRTIESRDAKFTMRAVRVERVLE